MTTTTTRAAVLRSSDAPFTLEDLVLRALEDDEVLVDVHAVGMCRTDFWARRPEMTERRPVVVGHEGAGIVLDIGPAVRGVAVGDHVVLSFDSCGGCPACTTGTGTCPLILELNMDRHQDDRSATDAAGDAVSARWFAQSSFATRAIASERNTVVVDADVPLDLLAPFGCSLSTGVGAVVHSLAVTPGSSIAVFGSGAVGMAAIMGARIAGAARIVAVDMHHNRLETACRIGATETVRGGETLRLELSRRAPGGFDYAVDTTGANAVVGEAMAATAIGGKIALVGGLAGPLALTGEMLQGRTVIGVLGGGRAPRKLVPQLVAWWRDGLLPVHEIVTRFPLSAINDAEAASRAGSAIKPVLLPDH